MKKSEKKKQPSEEKKEAGNRTLIDAKPEHYGKFVVVESFNDNTVVDFNEDPMKCKVEKGQVQIYCPAPCEYFIGGPVKATFVRGETFDACLSNPQCPKCKHLEKRDG